MRRSNKGVILLLCCLAAVLFAIVLVSTSLSGETDQDRYLRDIKEVETVINKMNETGFQEQLNTTLKNEGYQPTGSYSYTIFSMEEKEMAIVLHGLDESRRKVEAYIQELTNQLSTSIGLGTFEVRIIEDKD